MAQAVTIPQFGQTVEECTIVEWHKKEGDMVAQGDVLFEIETDKAVLEVESFFEGTLLKIIVPAGETVPVQTVVGFVGEPGEPIPEVETPAPKPTAAPVPTPVIQPVPTADVAAPVVAATGAAAPVSPKRFTISPRAAKLACDKVIDPTPIVGTGPDGRVVERDVLTYLDQRGYDRLRVTPAAKNLAAQEQLDLFSIQGTGRDGKITVADVRRAVAEKPKPMSKMRRLIAERLTDSYTSTPHFFTTVSVDITDLAALRAEYKQQGIKFTVTDFIMKATTMALEEFPEVNSTTDGKSVWWHSRVNLGGDSVRGRNVDVGSAR